MFKKPTDEDQALDKAITNVLNELNNHTTSHEDYVLMVEQLEKLYAFRSLKRQERVSKDTLITVGANLLGIVIIVGHERANVITTKALGLIKQLR